jgi:hypothetical protein
MDSSVIIRNFHNLLHKLIKQLGVVYPESASLLSASVYIASITEEDARVDIMQQYYDSVKNNFDEMRDHDIGAVTRIIDDSPLLCRLGLNEIIRDPDFQPSADVFFSYLDQLTSFSRMQFEISARMLKAIQKVGRELSERVKGGYMPSTQAEIEELGKRVVQILGEDPDSKYIMKETQKLLDILTESEQFEAMIAQAMNSR